MTHTVRYATWITGTSVATLLLATPAAATMNRPARDDTNHSQTVLQVVDVPVAVPVDDTTNEVAQMAIAAALGAAVAAATRRRRSRHHPTRTAPSIIDITDTVRL
jgi:MYXO-CTERM domain-containing protein